MERVCALFDMDGTIFESGISFLAIRQQLGLAQNGMPILEQLQQLPPDARARGIDLLHAAEAAGAESGSLIPGAAELLGWLEGRGIACALITNNSRRSADAVLARHPLPFDLVLTRDDGATKPNPELFQKALKEFGVRPSQAIAIGDTHLDALAAHAAGIEEIHLVALPSWMAELIPAEVTYTAAANLADAKRGIDDWLQRIAHHFRIEDKS